MKALLDSDEAGVLDRFPGATRVTVGALVTRDAGKGVEILLVRRAGDDDFAGIEELPSGGMEPGESVADTLRREVLEETGLVVAGIDGYAFDFAYPSRSGLTVQLNFRVPVPADAAITLDRHEHTDWRWVAPDEAGATDVTANVRGCIDTYFARP